MRVVIDASVAIKWVIRDALLDPDAGQALAIVGDNGSHYRGVRATALGR